MCYIFENVWAQGCEILHSHNYEKDKDLDNVKDKDRYKDKDKDKDKVQIRPNMCYIFEKVRAQGCEIWHSHNYEKD